MLCAGRATTRKKMPSLALVKEPDESRRRCRPRWKAARPFSAAMRRTTGATVTVPRQDRLSTAAAKVTGPLRRNGRTIELWNSDSFNYDPQNKPRALPVAPLDDGRARGWHGLRRAFSTRAGNPLLAHDRYQSVTSRDSQAGGPAFRVFVIDRDSPQAVLRGLGGTDGHDADAAALGAGLPAMPLVVRLG